MYKCVRVKDDGERKFAPKQYSIKIYLIVSYQRLIIYAVRYKSVNMRINWQTNRMYIYVCCVSVCSYAIWYGLLWMSVLMWIMVALVVVWWWWSKCSCHHTLKLWVKTRERENERKRNNNHTVKCTNGTEIDRQKWINRCWNINLVRPGKMPPYKYHAIPMVTSSSFILINHL